MSAPLKLEVGKRYVSRGGRITGTIIADGNDPYIFRDNEFSWTGYGAFLNDGSWHGLDLIAEYPAPNQSLSPAPELSPRVETQTEPSCPKMERGREFISGGGWTVAAESGDWFPVQADYSPIPATMEHALIQAASLNLLMVVTAYTCLNVMSFDKFKATFGFSKSDLLNQAHDALDKATGKEPA